MEDIKPQGKEGTILGKIYKSEGVIAVENKASSLIEKAKLNEAIKIIEGLEEEVRTMKISDRFSRTAKPSESVYAKKQGFNPSLKNLTEDQYKRETLIMALNDIKKNIFSAINGIEYVIPDIEATKQD